MSDRSGVGVPQRQPRAARMTDAPMSNVCPLCALRPARSSVGQAPGSPSVSVPSCTLDGSTGDAADPRKYYVYPLGTTWKSGNAATDAWSPGTGCNTPCPECAKGTVMPLWIPSNSDAAVTSTLSLADGALPRSCALSVDIMHPSCATTNVAGCTVACQYPYQNGDGGTQMRGVALSPSVCTYPNENFRA